MALRVTVCPHCSRNYTNLPTLPACPDCAGEWTAITPWGFLIYRSDHAFLWAIGIGVR